MIEVQYYWLGLQKFTASPASRYYWYYTTWLDGSSWPYRWWAPGFPRDRSYDVCICYSINGFREAPCDSEFYFIIEKSAGSSVFLS